MTEPSERIERKINCAVCGGKGWYEDHSDAHYAKPDGECPDCPVQRQCEKCEGRGFLTHD